MRPPRPVFTIAARDPSSRARAGLLSTSHGAVETPVFMPVATQGSVKALTQEDLESLGARILLANAYHLHLRPGAEVVGRAGGLHAFMGYSGALLTDSGGFQVMSLAPLRTVGEDGIRFKSHLDGAMLDLTPEKVVEIQARLGSDVWTTLDECVAWPCGKEAARRALERTMRWTERSLEAFRRSTDSKPARPLLFPILQGSLYPDLRRRAAEHLAGLPHDGVSLGGFSVGEPKAETWEVLAGVVDLLPEGKPRYLMGVGTPEDLWEAAAQGVDMMDCVWPTRVARHGMAMTRAGRLNVSGAAFREDFRPLDPDCACRVCRAHSRAYLCHLYRAKELAVCSLLTYHNLHYLLGVMRDIRRSILEGRFAAERKRLLEPSGSPVVT